ncbi:LytR C-terminal domain-containing protein [Nocardioides KLBMP 9356]|uniref:LytR C-terminal domain-containing protein n=1 Tax=Nocardioides potassii TaxID=2911371 RepID=A0ABS9HCQ2_9ACTN|nr:LytR C-terminal domain-containing protein [Nocardioides potassii]MCF6378087.1 LytR C-terminal domain-containing protein [Nocardioides potassii]
MSGALKSALTLAVLAVLVLVAAAWGWSALTAPFPQEDPVAICEDIDVAAGGEVRRDEVVVSVFNGSRRSGLAGSTMAELTERGFVEGQVGDSPQPAKTTQIWSSEPTNPAVLLVQQQFRRADIVPGDSLGDGITVVVGEKFKSLKKKQVESVTAESAATYCRATSSDAE